MSKSATVLSRSSQGMDAPLVRVEVHISGGLPKFSIVGLPETAVRESRDRVRSALMTCGYKFPQTRITANLAPADLPKTGTRFDLPIAIGILLADDKVDIADTETLELIGELGLMGALRPVGKVLSASLAAAEDGHRLCLPEGDRDEAALASQSKLISADSLPDLLDQLCDPESVAATLKARESGKRLSTNQDRDDSGPDLSEVVGHVLPKRALEIAAAGGHGILLIGPPGCGKSMLASRIRGLLPPMTEAEALETARIHSLSSKGVDISLWQIRPYRAPHHSASAAALVGGGGLPKPGEVSLAHNGVLFLDEIPEFSRFALEQLREPMESGGVSIARARARHWYPARFQLIAAMNPCPCGWYGESGDRCRCSPDRVEKYRGKVSGPLLDRMDLHVEVAPIPPESFADLAGLGSERSLVVRERVIQARDRQSQRGVVNSQLAPGSIFDRKIMTQEARRFLAGAAQQKRLTTRSHHRVFRVARTIADLADEQQIKADHIAEALNMRCLDRQSSAA